MKEEGREKKYQSSKFLSNGIKFSRIVVTDVKSFGKYL